VKNVEEIFFIPPMAVARVDGSNIPVASFTWKRIRICMGLDLLGSNAGIAITARDPWKHGTRTRRSLGEELHSESGSQLDATIVLVKQKLKRSIEGETAVSTP
jgi:hypothetical protein